MSSNWDGKERREGAMFSKDFYDKMMQMHADVRHMVKWSEDHDKTDNDRFNETNKKVDWVAKIAYMGLGGLAVIQFILSNIK